MPGPELTFFEKLRGKGRMHDIELPQEEGQESDPRLANYPSPGRQLAKGIAAGKKLMESTAAEKRKKFDEANRKASMEGLYNAQGK